MATVNFQCGHCHSLMAVGQEFLGQQVRCPHCQQVVLAPAPAPSPEPLSSDLNLAPAPRPDEHDSIFTPPESAQEDLFGADAAPRVELPTEPAFPPMALDEPTFPGESDAPPRPAPAEDPTVTYPGLGALPGASATEVLPPDGTGSAGAEAPAAGDGLPSPAADEGLPLPVTHKPRVARSNPWVIPLFIAPLIFYSLMATLYILDMQFFHFFSPPPPPNSLEILPDIEGDNAGAAKHGGKRSSRNTNWDDPLSPLAANLRVRLGGTLAVGDLEVTPRKVERKRISYAVGQTKERAPEDSLAVYLRLRNRSRDVVFKPMDRFFARARPTALDAIPQYTILEMGDRKFYGGPLNWVPLAAARKPNSQAGIEYVDQQVVNQELQPGEVMETFVCTNPKDKAAKALDGYQGPLLWRVQLRRGLVKWTTRAGVAREDSATTVVGVEFTSADVGKASD
jgi:hypothetical protein